VRNPLALRDLQLLHLGLKLFVRQLTPINVVALVIQRRVVRVKSCGKMKTLALCLRFSVQSTKLSSSSSGTGRFERVRSDGKSATGSELAGRHIPERNETDPGLAES
jgi:hypothetical protein